MTSTEAMLKRLDELIAQEKERGAETESLEDIRAEVVIAQQRRDREWEEITRLTGQERPNAR